MPLSNSDYLRPEELDMKRAVGPLNRKNISISPNFRRSDWQLALANNDWKRMVEIFEDRIEGRFLSPIRHIASDRDIGEFAGFSILALDCLIIETMHQFHRGIDETENNHSKAFWEFFRDSEFFRPHFSKKRAEIFYSHIRCGLLHQAQTKKKSLVRMDQKEMIQAVYENLSEGIIIDRSIFHDALEWKSAPT